jgi:hypothetical protein
MISLILLITVMNDKAMPGEKIVSYDTPRASKDVRIGPHGLDMPLGYIFLIRKGSIYGAVKVLSFSKGWLKYSDYAKYDSWFQRDGSGDFNESNVLFKNQMASSILFGLGRLSFNIGNEEIRCGSFNLWWGRQWTVNFYDRSKYAGDYGIELAPTKWIDIKDVKVFDHRVKWYRFDEKRPYIDIPIDELW